MKRILLLLVISFFDMNIFGQIHERQVDNFVEIPKELLSHIEKMGIDSSSILNEYEGKYFNFIFKVNSQNCNLVGKKVFNRSKMGFFKDEREWFYRGEKSGVGGAALYIFNAVQKEESGGYDAAIVYWRKRKIPTEDVIKSLKRSKNYYITMNEVMKYLLVSTVRHSETLRSWHWMKGTNHWDTHSRQGEILWRQTLKINKGTIVKYGQWLNKLENAGKLVYSVELSSCVTHTSVALNLSGIFNIGIHPYLLNAQMYLWSHGLRPWIFSYLLNQ